MNYKKGHRSRARFSIQQNDKLVLVKGETTLVKSRRAGRQTVTSRGYVSLQSDAVVVSRLSISIFSKSFPLGARLLGRYSLTVIPVRVTRNRGVSTMWDAHTRLGARARGTPLPGRDQSTLSQ